MFKKQEESSKKKEIEELKGNLISRMKDAGYKLAKDDDSSVVFKNKFTDRARQFDNWGEATRFLREKEEFYENALNELERLRKAVCPQIRAESGERTWDSHWGIFESNGTFSDGVHFIIDKAKTNSVKVTARIYREGELSSETICQGTIKDFLNGKGIDKEFKASFKNECFSKLPIWSPFYTYSLEFQAQAIKELIVCNNYEQEFTNQTQKAAYVGKTYVERFNKTFLTYGDSPEDILSARDKLFHSWLKEAGIQLKDSYKLFGAFDIGSYNPETGNYENFQRRDMQTLRDSLIIRRGIVQDIKNHGLKPEKQLVDKIEQYNGIKGKIHSLNEILNQDASERDSTAGMLQKEITSEVHRQTALKARGVIEVQSLHPVP